MSAYRIEDARRYIRDELAQHGVRISRSKLDVIAYRLRDAWDVAYDGEQVDSRMHPDIVGEEVVAALLAGRKTEAVYAEAVYAV